MTCKQERAHTHTHCHQGPKAMSAMTKQESTVSTTHTSTVIKQQLVTWPGNKTMHSHPLGSEGNVSQLQTKPQHTHLHWGHRATCHHHALMQKHTLKQCQNTPCNNAKTHLATTPKHTLQQCLPWGQRAMCVITLQQDHNIPIHSVHKLCHNLTL